jgi:hypothetical protein
MTFTTVGGGVLAVVAAQVQLDSRQRSSGGLSRTRDTDIPERAAATVLQALGLTFGQADAVARRPLPSGDILSPFPPKRT